MRRDVEAVDPNLMFYLFIIIILVFSFGPSSYLCTKTIKCCTLQHYI